MMIIIHLHSFFTQPTRRPFILEWKIYEVDHDGFITDEDGEKLRALDHGHLILPDGEIFND